MSNRYFVVAALMALGTLAATVVVPGAAAQELPAQADTAQVQPAIEAAPDGLELIREQQLELKATLEAGDTEGLTPREVNRIRKDQDAVFALIDGKSTLDALSINEKVELENALERINAQVKNTRAGQDEQQVCWRERVSGSKMNVTRCGTKAEILKAREGARDFMERPKVCSERCG